jgi:hypothetical protein
MPNHWSREEDEAAVADYLAMLRAERDGLDYNKSEHRRALARLLAGRSEGSIERKHENISAVLINLGMPYIEGYKPLPNYQQLLFDVVADQVANASDLHAAIRAEIAQLAHVPTIEDILASLVDPPTARKQRKQYAHQVREVRVQRLVDYPALEASNRSLGAAGEEFTVRFEQARLLAARKERLASAVERVSVTRGDGLGFDVLSYEPDGRERWIEVKTTSYGPATPFFVTRNEVDVSRRDAERFRLFRVFDFRRRPRLFEKPGQIEHSFWLDPVQFSARLSDQ